MGEKWNGKVLEFGIAKWIGYFSQKIGYRILGDCLKDLKVNDPFVDFIDVKHYQENIRKVVRETMDTEDRIWLIASY